MNSPPAFFDRRVVSRSANIAAPSRIATPNASGSKTSVSKGFASAQMLTSRPLTNHGTITGNSSTVATAATSVKAPAADMSPRALLTIIGYAGVIGARLISTNPAECETESGMILVIRRAKPGPNHPTPEQNQDDEDRILQCSPFPAASALDPAPRG